mmetsp:Transcript_13253/g.22802  ORF Transcript_13253/g.22802 Transcript_13253/m.22802 type:complete len:322 (+) Transcript_13253:42-1007(+)
MLIIYITLLVLINVELIFTQSTANICNQKLSSCDECLRDPNDGCVMCTSGGLAQCLHESDSLAILCKSAGTVITNSTACPTDPKTLECAAFSTNNTIDCAGCLAAGCGWCKVGSNTGSCHNGASDAGSICGVLYTNAKYLEGNSSTTLAECPAPDEPINYCPLYLSDCDACTGDASCGLCIEYQNNVTCTLKSTCMASVDKDALCLNNDELFMAQWLPDTSIQCSQLRDSGIRRPLAQCRGLTTSSTAAGATSTTAAGGATPAPGNGDGSVSSTLPVAGTSGGTLADISSTVKKPSAAASLSVSRFCAPLIAALAFSLSQH